MFGSKTDDWEDYFFRHVSRAIILSLPFSKTIFEGSNSEWVWKNVSNKVSQEYITSFHLLLISSLTQLLPHPDLGGVGKREQIRNRFRFLDIYYSLLTSFSSETGIPLWPFQFSFFYIPLACVWKKLYSNNVSIHAEQSNEWVSVGMERLERPAKNK